MGGPADLYAEPLDPDDLVALVAALDADGIPWFIIGGGSNLLVRDGGFRGAAISLSRLDFIEPCPGGIYAGAGVGSRALASHARERGLTGLEFLAGIPGTLGGALRMNAGAHGSEILDHVSSVEMLCDGRLVKIERKALDYGYRCLQLDHNKIIIAAEFLLAPGNREMISATIDGYLEKRRESQRVGFPTAGSFFKNPPGLAAWRLIDEAGLRGRSVGGAQVSEIHANFLVNRGGATAADFEQLAALIRERVLARSGVRLEDEVRTIGEEKRQDIIMSSMKSKRVAVLMGGLSAEREVSLKSGTAVHEALASRGYDAVAVDVGRDLPEVVKREAVGAAFIALHGRYGEDGCVQGLLELMGIPYTGSGVLASALAMHKFYSKQAFVGRGILTAPFHCIQRGEPFSLAALPFGLPLVVKPVQEGSSVGISIVRGEDELEAALELAFRYDDEVLVEQFIDGREVQIGILNDRPIGAIEIVPKNEFYDFEAKYTDGMAEHIFPARLEPDLYEKAQRTGLAAHRALGCSGYSRVDLLVTPPGECFVLEVNTLPGMTALSLLPEIAAKGAGLTFGELVERIIESASLKMKAG